MQMLLEADGPALIHVVYLKILIAGLLDDIPSERAIAGQSVIPRARLNHLLPSRPPRAGRRIS